jgi:hypothetical protein
MHGGGSARHKAYVYSTGIDKTMATYHLSQGGFINDVAVTAKGAWFTDSTDPALYFVPMVGGSGLGWTLPTGWNPLLLRCFLTPPSQPPEALASRVRTGACRPRRGRLPAPHRCL